MCDKSHYDELAEAKEEMAKQIGEIDRRLVAVETKIAEMSDTFKVGFAEIKAQLYDIYGEKKLWADWARNALDNIGRWCAKWGGVIILTAIGLSNCPKIAEAVKGMMP